MAKAGGGRLALVALVLFPALAPADERRDCFAAVSYAAGPSARHNRAALVRLMDRAVQRGANLIVLPELAMTGSLRVGASPEPVSGPTLAFFQRYAEQHEVWLAVPFVESSEAEAGYYVTTVLLDSGGQVAGRYRKRTPRPDGSDGPGLVRDEPKAPLDSLDAGGRRIGLLSGDDLRLGVPRLAERGAHVILVAAGWGTGEAVDFGELCRKLSREYRVVLVVASRGGVSGLFRDGELLASSREGVAAAVVARPPEPVRAPLGLPSVPVPTDFPFSPALVSLGRALFFETGLSSNNDVSCATCHQPERAFADGRRNGVGVEGRRSARNVPSLLNVAFRESLFWDGSSASLEHMAKFPMSHVSEMNFHYLDAAAWVRQQPFYAARFKEVLGDRRIEFEDIARALGAYQRTLVSGDSPFDEYAYGGRSEALGPSARKGLALFTGKAGCVHCHTLGPRSALFSDQQAHNTGIGYAGGYVDLGRGALDDGGGRAGFFMTPSLRNVALTAPYMHDGSLATLEEVVDFYDRGGGENPLRDPLLRPLHLTDAEKGELVGFLHALTGKAPPVEGPLYAALPFTPTPGDLERNRRELARWVGEAARGGARVVVLPEFAQSGPLASQPPGSYARLSLEETLAWLAPLARSARVWVAAPVLVPDSRAGWRQGLALVDDHGAVAAVSPKASHRKEWGDGETLAGDLKQLPVVWTPFGHLGLLAGDDLAEGVPRLARLGAKTILVSASWEPSDVTDWASLAAGLARQYRVDLAIANPGGRYAPVARSGQPLAVGGELGYASFGPVDAGLPAPLGLPPVPVPSAFEASAECTGLGRALFFDPRLSQDGEVSCAKCHVPEQSFSDGRKVGRGVRNRSGHFNVPSLMNVGYRSRFFWDGRADSLEGQIPHALQGFAEMDSSVETMVRYLDETPAYRDRIRRLSGSDSVAFDTAVRCIASFERTLVSGDSPFDRFHYGGDPSAISAAAQRGFEVFTGKGNCSQCHTVGERWALFTDNGVHNTGIGYQKRFEYLGYAGDGLDGNLATKNTFHGEYVTPSLRDVARSAPYMHDGSLATLAEVVAFYDRGGTPNPRLDPLLKPLHLTDREKADLVEFLTALTRHDRPELGEEGGSR